MRFMNKYIQSNVNPHGTRKTDPCAFNPSEIIMWEDQQFCNML